MPDPLSPLQLMTTQVETLYRVDEAGRLVSINEADERPAALFFLGRTVAGNIWRCRSDLPDKLQAELDALCRAEPVTTDFSRPPRQYETIKRLVHQYRPILSEWRGPAYAFPDHFTYPSRGVLVSDANLDLLQGPFIDLQEIWPLVQPCLIIVEEGRAVSFCFSSRTSALAAEAGVETMREFRGRGYAAAVVAEWAKTVRAAGRRPLYSTSWDNLASQGVAKKLGLIFYGEDCSFSE